MDNQPNTTAALPLDAFFAILQENGFTVTPGQIINAQQIIMQYGAWVKNESELCQYLVPVFAGDEEEQELFINLFNIHLKRKPLVLPVKGLPKPPIDSWLKKHWKSLIFLYAILSVAVVTLIWFTATRHKSFSPENINVTMVQDDEASWELNDTKTFTAKTGQPLNLKLYCNYNGRKTELTTAAVYNWGDSVENDLPYHKYQTPGLYTLKANVFVLYKEDTVKRYRFVRKVTVCDGDKILTLEISKSADSLFVKDVFYVLPKMNWQGHADSIIWWVDNKNWGSRAYLKLSYKLPGTHSIIATYPNKSVLSDCVIQTGLSINIINKTKKDTTARHLSNTPIDTTPEPRDDNSSLTQLYILLSIAFAMMTVFFLVLWGREQNKAGHVRSGVLSLYHKIIEAQKAQKIPGLLPFRNKNYIPAKEQEIEPVVKKLRQRVKDTIAYLHIKKTIHKTIERAGLFTPVKEARTRQGEYLVLIDQSNPASMITHQQEYLALLLKRYGVLYDKFYYSQDAAMAYNDNIPAGIPFEKLHNRYPRHILIVMGTGYQFIDSASKQIKNQWTEVLMKWQHRVLITPISFMNWGQQEKEMLMPVIPVVPADMEGLALMAEILSRKENDIHVLARLNQNSGVFYDTKEIDFYTVNGLMQYCQQARWATIKEYKKTTNVILEWLSALAVYTTLRWEIVLVTGKVIFEQYDKARWLNYSALLKLVRIPWMAEGRMPDELRFELLKRMSVENEKLIRQALLQLMHEIPESETEAHPEMIAEKEVQQVINEFSLYANDPQYFSGYRPAKAVFEKLWKENRINDKPLQEYLANENNEWKTIIGNNSPTSTASSVNKVNAFLIQDDKEETLLSKLYLVLAIISIIVLVSSLFALRIIYIWNQTGY